MTEADLLALVEDRFGVTAVGLPGWADPHDDADPLEAEYSRVTDGQRWRIVAARADAWLEATALAGLAIVERDVLVRWDPLPDPHVIRTDVAVPLRSGALPLVVGRSRIGGVDDASVTVGVGAPAVPLARVPFCGCDACDDGSQEVLDEIDARIFGVVSGAVRALGSGERRITVLGGGRSSASGTFDRGEVEAVLADPSGWTDVGGVPWFDGPDAVR